MPASERVAPKPASLRTRRFATLAAVAALGVAGWLPTSYFMSLLVREQLGGGIAGAALVIGTMHLSRAIGAAITGRWVTRLESRAVYALGLAGMTTLMVMLVLAPDVAWVIVAAPLAGLSMAYFWAGLQTYVIEIAPPSRRGAAVGVIGFVVVLVPGVAGVAQGFVAEAFGFRVFAIAAGSALAAALLLTLGALPRPTSVRMPQPAPSISFARLVRSPAVTAVLVVRAASTVGYAAMVLLAGPRVVDVGGDLRAVGVMTLVAAVGGAAAQLAIGRLSDRFSRRTVLFGTIALAAPATAAFGFVDSVPGLLVVATVWAVAMWGINTMAVSLCGDVAPSGSLSRVMVLDGTAFSAGAVIGRRADGSGCPGYSVLRERGGLLVGWRRCRWLRRCERLRPLSNARRHSLCSLLTMNDLALIIVPLSHHPSCRPG